MARPQRFVSRAAQRAPRGENEVLRRATGYSALDGVPKTLLRKRGWARRLGQPRNSRADRPVNVRRDAWLLGRRRGQLTPPSRTPRRTSTSRTAQGE